MTLRGVTNDEKIWNVYVHTSPSNKKYVGITSQVPEKRWCNGKGYTYNSHFNNAIKKYGWDNFQHEVIYQNMSRQDAKEMEIALIKQYNSNNAKFGYNRTIGGDGASGVRRFGKLNSFYNKHHTDETKQKISIANREAYQKNPNLASHSPVSEKRKTQIGLEHSKPIMQYDLNMNFIQEHKSLLDLEKLGYRRASIRAVCMGKRDSYQNYIWKYKNDADAWLSGYVVGTKTKNIFCLDKNYLLIGTYKSYSEASRETGINRHGISEACKSENHLYFGFYWFYKDDYSKLNQDV